MAIEFLQKRQIELNFETSNYILTEYDAAQLILMNSASANTLTVPANSSVDFIIGEKIYVTQWGTGQTTIVADSGVTINSQDSNLTIAGQYAIAQLTKVATDEWLLTRTEIGLSSVDLTVPSAFQVTGVPLTSNGTIAITGAGAPSQYIRGDGTLASFPSIAGGGGGQVMYFNGNTSQGTIDGDQFEQLSTAASIGGPNSDFTSSTVDGNLIASFITNIDQPYQETVPAGVWLVAAYFSSTSSTAEVYAEVEVYTGGSPAFTLISGAMQNEQITNGSTIDLYTFSIPIAEYTPLNPPDRIAIRFYATNLGGVDTVTLHTEGPHISSVQTTFTTGLSALNGATLAAQYLQVGTSGLDFTIDSISTPGTHVFNLPNASASSRGVLTSSDWSLFNGKQNALTFGNLSESTSSVLTITGGTGAVIGGGSAIQVKQAGVAQSGYLSFTDWNTFNDKVTSLTAGTGISIGGTTTVPIITNTLPDQTVVLTQGGTTTITGTYPNFTISSADQFTGTVTSVAALTLGTTGTDLSSSVANGTTTPVITLNVPTASATNRGALSSSDWSTFNGKFNLPSLTSGSVLFSNGTTIAQDNANFYWDDSNDRLGIGTNSPSEKLEVNGNIKINDAGNIVLGTVTGTKIGTSTSQLLGFYNATPIAQPAAVTSVQGLATALGNLGLIATSAVNVYQTVEDEGSAVTQRTNINFVGSGVSVADSGGKTVVTISGGVATSTLTAKSGDFRTVGGASGTVGTIAYSTPAISTSAHTGNGNNQTAERMVTFILPPDFSSFPTNALNLIVLRTNTPDSFTVTMKKVGTLPLSVATTATADSTINGSNIIPTLNNTFEKKQFTPGSSYAAGDIVTIVINSQVDNNVFAEVASVELVYNKSL
jgi:hypothetical protein